MSFAGDLQAFQSKVLRRNRAAFVGTADRTLESITEGSALTGAPGQPVDTGTLKSSWQLWFPETWLAEISTNIEYAPFIEYGGFAGMPTGKSVVGGHGSVQLTRANMDRLVQAAVVEAR